MWLLIVLLVASLIGTAIARRLSREARAAVHHRSTTSTSSSTTTTVTPTPTVGPLDHGTVTVGLPAGAYTVTVAARGACWMQAERPDRTVVVSSTLQAGDSREIPGA